MIQKLFFCVCNKTLQISASSSTQKGPPNFLLLLLTLAQSFACGRLGCAFCLCLVMNGKNVICNMMLYSCLCIIQLVRSDKCNINCCWKSCTNGAMAVHINLLTIHTREKKAEQRTNTRRSNSPQPSKKALLMQEQYELCSCRGEGKAVRNRHGKFFG